MRLTSLTAASRVAWGAHNRQRDDRKSAMANAIQAGGVVERVGLACWAVVMVSSMLVASMSVLLAAVRARVTIGPDDGSHHQGCCSKCCNHPFRPPSKSDAHTRFSSPAAPYGGRIRRHQDNVRGQRADANAGVCLSIRARR